MPYPIYDTVTTQTAGATERELSFRLLREILEENNDLCSWPAASEMRSTPAVAVVLAAVVVYCLCKWLHFRLLILHWFGVLGKPETVIGPLPRAGFRLSHPSPGFGSEERQSEAIPSLDNVHRKSGWSDFSDFSRMLCILNFCAEILHPHPSQPYAELQIFLALGIVILGQNAWCEFLLDWGLPETTSVSSRVKCS